MFNDELLTLYPSVNISPSLTQNSRGFMTLHMISVELDSRGGPRMSEGGRAKMDKEGKKKVMQSDLNLRLNITYGTK